MWQPNTLAAALILASSLASAASPTYTAIFENPLVLPPIATPYTSVNVDGQKIDFYEITILPFQKQVFPDLAPTDFLGYNGFAPGPTFYVEKGTQTVVRFNNNHTQNSVVHLHGSWTHSPWDGFADDVIEPNQFKDYYYPNNQSARTLWYHDHASGITSSNCFSGLTAGYIIYDPAEDYLNLPTGKYDVPLLISDKEYNSDGSLVNVSDDQEDFFGDMIEVNYQPWPYLEVEPRKYRLRLYNMATSRPFDLHVEQSNGDWVDFQVIASDSGLFGAPVSSNDVVIAGGERYEIVVDFSQFAGQNLTMKNAYSGYGSPLDGNTDLVMSFVVGNIVEDWTSNDVPSVLNPSILWPESKTGIDHSFRFSYGGDDHWTINGVAFDDINNRILAKPKQGTTEIWEFVYASGPGVHPVHIHAVDFQIISRTGGSRGILPYESAGLKDIVLLEPGETVQVLAYYGPYSGVYTFHCHNLVHEDHMMMAAYNITALADLGYDDVQGLSDPNDPRFQAQWWSAESYEDSSISSTLSYLGGLGAYNQMTQMVAAEVAYYSTNPSAAIETWVPPANTEVSVTTTTSSIYADPTTSSTYAAPTTSSIYVAPTTSSIYVAPTTSSIYVAPTTSSTSSSQGNNWGGHGSRPAQAQSWGSNQNWANRGQGGQNWGYKGHGRNWKA